MLGSVTDEEPPAPGSGHVIGYPRGPAADFVCRYEAHSFSGLPPGFHRGLPSRVVTFRFSFGEPTEIVTMPDPAQPSGAYYAFVGGLHRSPALVAHPGYGSGIGIDLSPLTARRLFGLPGGELGSIVVDLADLLGPTLAAEMNERLALAGGWPARFEVLDRLLGALVAEHRLAEPPPEVREAWRFILARGGRTTVAEVAGRVGWSRRHLGMRFAQEVGLSPKAAIRVVRFEQACARLLEGRLPLASVAVAAGYYDQAHLNRDFLDLAGATPLAWLGEEMHDPPREEFPFVQYQAAAVGAS
jgi:AraC-like DNA-binding protein